MEGKEKACKSKKGCEWGPYHLRGMYRSTNSPLVLCIPTTGADICGKFQGDEMEMRSFGLTQLNFFPLPSLESIVEALLEPEALSQEHLSSANAPYRAGTPFTVTAYHTQEPREPPSAPRFAATTRHHEAAAAAAAAHERDRESQHHTSGWRPRWSV
jgi:hypothetical protein